MTIRNHLPADRSEVSLIPPVQPTIELFWIPLGAGGSGFVRFNGRVYEALASRRARRRALALYHTALRVRSPEGTYLVETTWPSPDPATWSRGVVVEGPVGWEWAGRIRTFRYEVRCWRDGVLPDEAEAVGGLRVVSEEPEHASRLVEVIGAVPALIWGRDQLGVGEMWNSNSVISWALARVGIPIDVILPPEGGRAPGWKAGIAAAAAGMPPPPQG